MQQQLDTNQGCVIQCEYDYEYERKLRDELAELPPMPTLDERIAPGCFITKPAPFSE